MSRFNIVYQCEQEDCGAACLAMIVRSYGFRVSLEAIRVYCGNLKNGVTMYGLNRAAIRMGFNARAVRLNAAELLEMGNNILPFVAHWRQQHFVVVYDVSPQCVCVADPSLGRVKYDFDEFSRGFFVSDDGDGFALLLTPDRLDRQTFVKSSRSSMKLWGYITPHKIKLVALSLSMLALSLIGMAFPFLTQAVVDKGIANKDQHLLVAILCATLSLALGRAFFSFIQSRMALLSGTMIDIDMSRDLLSRIASLPMRHFTSRKVGDMIQRVADVSRIGDYFSSRVAESAFAVVMFCVYGGILFYLYPMLFVVFVIGAVLYLGYSTLFLGKRKVLDYELFRASARSQDELIQYLRGMVELKLACAANDRLEVWKNTRNDLFDASKRSLMLSQRQELGSVFIFQIVDAIEVFIIATAVMAGVTTLGTMMAVQYVIGNMTSPLRIVTQFIRDTQSMKIALARINYVTSASSEHSGAEVFTGGMPPTISVKGVTFAYDIDAPKPALHEVDVIIPAGKTTALVGMSGSGKTTFLKLLLGFYTPDAGTITVNGLPLDDLDIQAWRRNVGAVMQDGYIFSDTIINNVALGDPSPSLERVVEALRAACADFVHELPVGLRTIIGSEGMSLSSGQRQRVLLARAIYKRPSLFLLDEATNAVDAINEHQIYANLNNEFKDKTVVIAAHRLSSISNADQILVFDNGRIVEFGTHDQLLAANGKYAELVKNQRFS